MSVRLCDRDREAGFTLIEILCVLVIIGVMTGIVAINMRVPNTDSRTLETDLLSRFRLSAKEAIVSGHPQAFSVTETGWQFMSYQDQNWLVHYSRDFENNEQAALSVEEEVVTIPEDPVPLIIFEPTGEVSTFLFSVRGHENDILIASRRDGSIGLGLGDEKAFQ